MKCPNCGGLLLGSKNYCPNCNEYYEELEQKNYGEVTEKET